MLKKLINKNLIFALLMAVLMISSLVGCSTSTTSHSNEEFGTITGTFLDAANSNIIATSDVGEYLVPVDSYGNFSANIPVGTYRLSYRSSATNKIVLTTKTVCVANNMAISIVDAELVPQPQVLYVNIPVVSINSAIIEWETDVESDGYVEYGTNELYGVSTFVSTELTTRHRVQITDLLPNTTYHFRVVSSRHNIESSRFLTRDYTITTTNN